MLFDAIFISLFASGWLACGLLPWLALSVATRGHAGLRYLPLSLFAGLVGGLSVPLLGKDDGAGIWLSMVAALLVPSLLLAARRLSLHVAAAPAAGATGHRSE